MQQHTWSVRGARWRTTWRARGVSLLATISMLATMWRPTYASPDGGGRPGAAGRAPRSRPSNDARAGGDWVLTRLAPIAAEWQRPEGARAATVLFDGDQATSLGTGGDAHIRVTLAGPRPIRGIGVFGRAEGRLSVSTVDGGRETPVAGMQDLDLRALPLRWNRFWASGTPPVVGELALRWRPASATAALRELEIFGDGPDVRADQGPAPADRVLAGTASEASETSAEPEAETISGALGLETPTVFHLRLRGDPRLMGRTFLVYELTRRPHWSAVRRQVNGFSVQGGFGDESAAGGVQVEEISPEWLFQGDNQIHFFPGEDGDPIGYGVRRLRIVSLPGTDDAAGGPAGGQLAGRGTKSVTLPLSQGAQPSAVSVRVVEPLAGQLLATTIRADGKPGPRQELDVAGLGPGWHTLPLERLAAGKAVRFTWSAGREETGFLSELRLGTSPPPDGPGRRLVVSYPLHGECVDHKVYVSGFVTGQMAEAKRPLLLADGAVVQPGVAADGAFSFTVPEPATFRGRSWNIALGAHFADGGELGREIRVDACADRPPLVSKTRKPGEPKPLIEDERAPYGKLVDADEGAELSMGGARIAIPAGALAQDTRVTIRPLGAEQVAPLDDALMDNVTPDRKAFRFGPHNLTFDKPARVSIPYDRGLVSGAEPDELGIFYFDDELGRWQRLPTEQNGRNLVAETTHFTDFIAATLKKPDHPTAVMNTPNMIRDLKIGDPAAGVTMVQPPVPRHDGTATLTFPIPVPAGRNGMQPNLDLVYSSEGVNGLLGVGWTFPTPNIQMDTKTGVQRQTFNADLDRYLLNGDELVAIAGEPIDNRRYRRRIEGSFDKIVRSDGDARRWTVTDQNGTVHEYGTASRIDVNDGLGSGADAFPVYWPLNRSTDTFGNTVEYTYTIGTGALGSPNDTSAWNAILPGTITYSANASRGQPARFRITFSHELRPDVFSTARLGREMRTRHRIKELRIENQDLGGTWRIFRQYDFKYVIGEFGKSLLKTVNVHSGDDDQLLFQHRFDYQTIPRDANGRVVFGSPQVWGTMDGSGALGRRGSISAGASGFAGVGPISCYPHVGGGMSGGGGSESTSEVFQDVNGDGLPDVLRRDGRVFLNRLTNAAGTQGAFTSTAVTGPVDVGQSYNWSRTFGLGLHFPGELGANFSTTASHTVQTKGLVDMNGDGLPDQFFGNKIGCNAFPGSTCTCDTFPGLLCNPSSSTPGAPFAVLKDWSGGSRTFPVFVEPNMHGAGAGNTSFKTFMFTRWTAPYAGTINLTAPAQRATVRVNPLEASPDDVTARVYMRYHDPPALNQASERLMWSRTFGDTDAAACNPVINKASSAIQTTCAAAGGVNLTVAAGDEFYFIVGSFEGNKRNALLWNPTITYTDAPCPSPANFRTCPLNADETMGGKLFRFSLDRDFQLAGGPYTPWVSASADTLENGSRPTPTQVSITGDIRKFVTTPEHIQFRILKLAPAAREGDPPVVSTVWSSNSTMPFGANSTGTFALNLTVDVQGKWVRKSDEDGRPSNWTVDGDQLVFQAVSDSPFNPAAVSWRPVVRYLNFCGVDAARQADLVRGGGAPVPNPSQVSLCTNNPASMIRPENVSQDVEVQFPAWRFEPSDPTRRSPVIETPTRPFPIYLWTDTATHPLNMTSQVQINPGAGVGAPSGSVVVLLVQTPTRLLAKRSITFTGTGQINQAFDVSNMSVRGDEPVYLTAIAYGLHRVDWRPTLTSNDGTMANFGSTLRQLSEAPLPGIPIGFHGGPTRDVMSGGHHQWSYGVYNGDTNFSKAGITIQRLAVNPNFVPAGLGSRGLNSTDPDLPSVNAPLWKGRGGDDYIAHPGVFHPSFSGAAAEAKSVPGAGFRRSTSSNSGLGVNAGFTSDESGGDTKSEIDLVDINGDGLPDLVGLDRVYVNDLTRERQLSFDASAPITFQFGGGAMRKSESRNRRWGIGLGSIASQMVNKPNAKGGTDSLGPSLPSFGVAYGTTRTSVDLMDINGDGLPDQVWKDPAAPGSLRYRLGLGLPYGIAFQPAATNPADQTISMPALESPQFSAFEGLVPMVATLLESTDTDTLRLENNASNSLQINIAGMGGGLAHSVSRTLVEMVDLNGDGLPDRVMKLPGVDGVIYVQFNYGMGFSAKQEWVLPGWGVSTEGVFANIGLGSNDALAFSQTRTMSVSGGNIFPIPIPFLFVCLMLEASVQGDDVTSNTQMSFQDINGDGNADHVFKRDDLTSVVGGAPSEVRAKLSPIGAADLLTHVEGPLGGGIDITYARAGNIVQRQNGIDMPHNRWVMSRVVVRQQPLGNGTPVWNAQPPQQTDIKYDGGYYDRNERQFLGFKTVTSTRTGVPEQLVIQETYDTTDIYRKGRLLKRVERKRASTATGADDTLPVLNVQETTLDARILQAPTNVLVEPRSIVFVVDRFRTYRSYEGGSTNPDTATVSRKETRDYDNTHGGITSFEDDAGTTATGDDIKFTVGYHQDTVRYIFKPNVVRALDSANTQLRRRDATYFTNGKLNTLSDTLVGGRNPATGADYNGTTPSTWTYNYDLLGIIKDVTDPVGYKITVFALDGETFSYPTNMGDSFGYQWIQRYNHLTGATAMTRDPNGVTTTYTFDLHNRPSGVKDTAGVELVKVEYVPMAWPGGSDPGQPAGAIISYRNPEQSQTLALADGWGRVMQTKKRADVDNGSGIPAPGLVVSGKATLDTYGRAVSQGQVIFRPDQAIPLSTKFDAITSKNPTTFKYDALSREIQRDLPVAASARANTIKTIYDVVSRLGVLRLRETVKDANQVDSEAGNPNPFPGQSRMTYRDARNRIVVVEEQNRIAGTNRTLATEYEYDQLDRVLRIFDAKENQTTAVWDSMDRLVSLTNPDTGRTRYDLDVGGNLGRKENARGQLIRYQRNFNRLEHIVYPTTTQVDLIYGGTTATAGCVGRLARRVDETGITDYQYDNFGAPKKTIWTAAVPAGVPQPTYHTDYVHEPVFNSLRTLTSDGETYTYSYDVQGNVKSVTGVRGGTTTNYATRINYDEFNQRTRLELGNGAFTLYAYDPLLRRLTSVDTKRGTVDIQKVRYTSYDFVGNLKAVANQVTAPTNPQSGVVTPGPTSQTFVYDNLHQLTSASGTYTGLGSLGGRTYSLAINYDEIGNITRKNQTDNNRPTTGSSNQVVTRTTYNNAYTYGGSRPHAATAVGPQTGSYDADGNQLSLVNGMAGRTMTWNEDNRMKTIVAAGVTSTFFYPPDGERAIKRATTETHYPNAFLAARVNGSKTHNVMVGDERIASVVVPASGAATTFYYHSDHLQSSNYTTDGAGNLTQHNEYLPSGETWFEELRGTGTANRQPYQFNAKELDDSGLYYYGARYYDPRQSQWVNPDPILSQYVRGEGNRGVFMPANLGLYGYAWNNPVVLKDPDGKIVWFAVIIGVTYGILTSSGTVTTPTDGSEAGTRPTSTAEFVGRVGLATAVATRAAGAVIEDSIPDSEPPPIGPPPPPASGEPAQGGGRAKNNFDGPDPAAEGRPHTRVRSDDKGVTHYETYDHPEPGQGKRVDATGSPHKGVPTPHVVDTQRHTNPNDPSKSRIVEGRAARPAEPGEIPKRRP
jgi:RHS repeat-associated protein